MHADALMCKLHDNAKTKAKTGHPAAVYVAQSEKEVTGGQEADGQRTATGGQRATGQARDSRDRQHMEETDRLIVTLQDIAEEVGVSRGTVDRALNHRGRVSEETAQRVREAAERLGYQKSLAATGLAARRKKLQLGFIYVTGEEYPFHRQIYEAAAKKAKELAQYGVTVYFLGISEPDGKQLEKIRRFILEHPQISGWAALGFFCDFLHQVWKENNMPEVPVVSYNLDTEYPEHRICFVGCDYRKAGRLACGLAALFSRERGRVLIVSEDMGDISSCQERAEGFRREMELYPAMRIADELYMNALGEEKRKKICARVVEKVESDPAIDVVYLMNPSDYRICDELHRAAGARHLAVITNDVASEEQKKMLLDGRITATIDQEPARQGKRPLELLFRYLTMDRKPEKEWEPTKLSIIIRQNLDRE